MIFYSLTDSEGDAGEGGGGVDGAAEQGLDVVSLGGVLAPAEVRAGLQSVISEPDISHVSPVCLTSGIPWSRQQGRWSRPPAMQLTMLGKSASHSVGFVSEEKNFHEN